MPSQDEMFYKKEGDRWFERNKGFFHMSPALDRPLFLMEQYALKPKRVLEIGCSNGWRLSEIAKKYRARCVGVDPSKKAIKDGKKQYPKITFIRGMASALPLKTTFDLVIVNYVLHWVSREKLLRAVAEIDRVVADGGYLIVGDFMPDFPTKNPYHHGAAKNVYTFKLDYAEIFTRTAVYQRIAQVTYNHYDRNLTGATDTQSRSACTLLKKSWGDYYCANIPLSTGHSSAKK